MPIGNVYIDVNQNYKTITLGRYEFDKDSGEARLVQSAENWEDTSDEIEIKSKKELENSSIGNSPAKDLEEFIKNTLSSNGYYIGRYEAGDAYAIDTERSGEIEVSNPDNPVTCKNGIYPYNYINQKHASDICKEMYSSTNFDSDLVNSYAWDTAIVFIQKFTENKQYSIKKSELNSIVKCGESNDIECNIYDLAENTAEFTTEASMIENRPIVDRGGCIQQQNMYTGQRGTLYIQSTDPIISFRPIIYL